MNTYDNAYPSCKMNMTKAAGSRTFGVPIRCNAGERIVHPLSSMPETGLPATATTGTWADLTLATGPTGERWRGLKSGFKSHGRFAYWRMVPSAIKDEFSDLPIARGC